MALAAYILEKNIPSLSVSFNPERASGRTRAITAHAVEARDAIRFKTMTLVYIIKSFVSD